MRMLSILLCVTAVVLIVLPVNAEQSRQQQQQQPAYEWQQGSQGQQQGAQRQQQGLGQQQGDGEQGMTGQQQGDGEQGMSSQQGMGGQGMTGRQQGMGGQGMSGQQQGMSQGGNGEIRVPSLNVQSAPVPEYWIADASIFISSAANAAQVLKQEQQVNVQAPQVIGNQAQFLSAAVQRAYANLQALNTNARQTSPDAVPVIRNVMAELVAAKAQAQKLSDTAQSGNLGPVYQSTVTAALQHLQQAQQGMQRIAQAYNATHLNINTGTGSSGSSMGTTGSRGGSSSRSSNR